MTRTIHLSLLALIATGVVSCNDTQDTRSSTVEPVVEATPPVAQTIKQQQADGLFEAALRNAQSKVDLVISEGWDVPFPKDPGGGYTHEKHKENANVLRDAGYLYSSTGDEKYLAFAREMLSAYAAFYNDLPLHPERKNQAPGRLFWQSLNEAVWLVNVIQGYEQVRDSLDADSRALIEQTLLQPMAEFLSAGSPQTFRRIHNHGTWAAAAVGMTGYVLDDEELVFRSLYGLDGDGEAGFLAQMNELFSPDGYYTEGPYYQRYALMPFVLFAQSIDRHDPELEIFKSRDEILLKAIYATINLSYNGKFFPINDAIKEKSIDTVELVYGVAAAYEQTKDPQLLDVALKQNKTVLNAAGKLVSDAISIDLAVPYEFPSQMFRDGAAGDKGALVVMRMGEGELAQTVVVKNTAQGMGHGHFDRLSYILYDNGNEIITDYGAARFLNVPSKAGGRYLPENQTWAKQTIAHNTPVVNGASQFGGKWRVGEQYWPEILSTSFDDGVNFVSSKLENAYPGTEVVRTLVQTDKIIPDTPILIDLVEIVSDSGVQIDLPVYFSGQVTETEETIEKTVDELKPLGVSNGYQHLWHAGQSTAPSTKNGLTWLADGRFYSLKSGTSEKVESSFVRTGANDPDNNLRVEQGYVLRSAIAPSHVFASVIEPHGSYDPVAETTVGSASQIDFVSVAEKSTYTEIKVSTKSGGSASVFIADDKSADITHNVESDDNSFSWQGPVGIHLEETE